MARAGLLGMLLALLLACAPAQAADDVTPPALTIAVPVADEVFAVDRPSFSGTLGTAEGDLASATVDVFAGDAVIDSMAATIDGDGWSAQPSAPLAEGAYRLRVRQSDETGNTAAPTVDFWIDLTTPLPSISAPDTWTNDPTPTLSGTAGEAIGDAAEVTVEIAGVLTQSAPVTGGKWQLTAPALADGAYSVRVRQTDDAGHTGEHERVLKVDTVAPALAITAPGPLTNDATPSLGGSAGTAEGDGLGVDVELFAGAAAAGEPLLKAGAGVQSGVWATRARNALGEGVYTLRATHRDAAGNAATVTHTFGVDLRAPVVTIDTPQHDAELTERRPVFAGAAGTAPGDAARVTVQLTGPVNLTLTAPVAAGRWATVPAAPLPYGVYYARVTQADAAGNLGGFPAVRRFVVEKDTEPPGIALPSTLKLQRTSLTAKITLDEAAAVTVKLQLNGKTVAQARKSAPQGAFTIRLKPKKRADLKRLRRKRARVFLVVKARDAAGNADTEKRPVKLKR